MSSNLPPGVTEDMIPGNRPEDLAWDNFYEWLGDIISKEGMSPQDCRFLIQDALDNRKKQKNLSIAALEFIQACDAGAYPQIQNVDNMTVEECVEFVYVEGMKRGMNGNWCPPTS